MKRDATLTVKAWILFSALLMFSGLLFRTSELREWLRDIGMTSLSTAVMVGINQIHAAGGND